MSITLDLQPEIEQGLLAQARAKGVSLTDYVQEIVAREAHVPKPSASVRTGQELIDACASVRGLADDLDIARNPSTGRPVDFT